MKISRPHQHFTQTRRRPLPLVFAPKPRVFKNPAATLCNGLLQECKGWHAAVSSAVFNFGQRKIIAATVTQVGNINIQSQFELSLDNAVLNWAKPDEVRLELNFIQYFGGFGGESIAPLIKEAITQLVETHGLATFNEALGQFNARACGVEVSTLYDESTSPPDVAGVVLLLNQFQDLATVKRGLANILNWVESLLGEAK